MVSFSIFISFKVIKNICAKLFLITAELIIKFVDKNISYHRLKERCYNLLIKRINTTNFNQRHTYVKGFLFQSFYKRFFRKIFLLFFKSKCRTLVLHCTKRTRNRFNGFNELVLPLSIFVIDFICWRVLGRWPIMSAG